MWQIHKISRTIIVLDLVVNYKNYEGKPCIFIIFGMDKNQNYDAETSLTDI